MGNKIEVRRLTESESIAYRATDDLPDVPVSPELARLIKESIESSQEWVADTATKENKYVIR